jgi:hypothetical protein
MLVMTAGAQQFDAETVHGGRIPARLVIAGLTETMVASRCGTAWELAAGRGVAVTVVGCDGQNRRQCG